MIEGALGMMIHRGAGLLAEASLQQRLWFGENASTFGDRVDPIFFYIFWVSTFFFVVLMALMVYWGIKYRRRPGVAPEVSAHHNTALELTWSIVPTILMAVMFYWGFREYLYSRVAPADAETIYVTAKKWVWGFEYRGGITSKQVENVADVDVPVFAVPANRSVNFVMTSTDVIHSLYVPAFRIKRDIFPNRYTTLWVKPLDRPTHVMKEVEPGKFQAQPAFEGSRGHYLFCTEYCGDQHSQMGAMVIVLSDADYVTWLRTQADTSSIPLAELGKLLWSAQGCNACHTVDGRKGTGPTWTGIWDETHDFTDGAKIKVDLNYIRESILEPAKHVRVGYANQMPSYQGKMTERELRAIAVFIKSLHPKFAAEAQAESDAEVAAQKAPADGAAAPAPATGGTSPGTPQGDSGGAAGGVR